MDTPENQEPPAPFSREEWDTLLKAPVVVFLFVSAVGGKVEPGEVAAFQQVLASAPTYRNELVRRVLLAVPTRLSWLLSHVLVGGRDAGKLMGEVAALVDARLAPEEALAFKRSLLHVGKRIADATRREGGTWRSDKLDALATLALVLGLDSGE